MVTGANPLDADQRLSWDRTYFQRTRADHRGGKVHGLRVFRPGRSNESQALHQVRVQPGYVDGREVESFDRPILQNFDALARLFENIEKVQANERAMERGCAQVLSFVDQMLNSRTTYYSGQSFLDLLVDSMYRCNNALANLLQMQETMVMMLNGQEEFSEIKLSETARTDLEAAKVAMSELITKLEDRTDIRHSDAVSWSGVNLELAPTAA